MVRRFAAIVLAAACTVSALLLAVPANSAPVAPTASLSVVNANINANTRPAFQYSFSNLPTGSVRYLQRQNGQAWQTVAQVSGAHGTVSAPAVGIGKYLYRLHVTQNGLLVVNSASRAVHASGKISLTAFCNGMDISFCSNGTEQVGGTTFHYVMYEYASFYPQYDNGARTANTSCSEIVLRFASSSASDVAYLKLVQAHTQMQTAQAAAGSIGTLHAALDGGRVAFLVATTNASDVRLAGTVTCYTNDGSR